MSEVKIRNRRVNSGDQMESVSKSMKDYNKASSMQLKLIEGGRGNIQLAAPLLPKHEGTVKVADFGCSYGRNSMFVMRHLLDEMKLYPNYISNLSNLVFYHEDLPDNDFDAVRSCVEDPEIGYPYHELVKQNNIRTSTECIGRTYYDQIVESESIDIAFCYTSLHWMPEYKETTYGLVYDRMYNDTKLTNWFDDMSERYLAKWLDHRHRELKEGGLVSFNIMTDTNMVDWVNENWKLALSQVGLDQKNFTKVNIPIYHRSEENLKNLLKKFDSKFKVIRCDPINDPAPVPRSGIRAGFYNQIVVGLAKYPEEFPDEESREKLFDKFEALLFKESDLKDINSIFQWIVLQKL
ncbi:S-adenosyl-L-methionine-dependent methyltransferase [Conidiobolus coronatus NRRL 28638]|uniref:S-adenosyl-L-methionine-dependent methyltransferase n=1 Tax=Conidiobolus coronatus (strain ATCC 28846 / CBS 209.66 / NRRL 28638) TaxID=796925 RepID=A0A137P0J9_CONC2|nr:S-adenosyl-L-methionine-dependent methyltransferase [Conidiobolus coronatus NRRL 28638]|eukprot:KXN68620.1 S-adenosyl-L-methionine-dependent methyltransferase [Conidiobolus coronatus NRRL 28638]